MFSFDVLFLRLIRSSLIDLNNNRVSGVQYMKRRRATLRPGSQARDRRDPLSEFHPLLTQQYLLQGKEVDH
jgi:hypothetical protein